MEQSPRRKELKALLEEMKNRKRTVDLDAPVLAGMVPRGLRRGRFVDSGIRFDDSLDGEMLALKEAVVAPAQDACIGRERKAVKTLLHVILEAAESHGKVSIRDLAKELCVDERLIQRWADVLEVRGMLRITYRIYGSPVIESIRTSPEPL